MHLKLSLLALLAVVKVTIGQPLVAVPVPTAQIVQLSPALQFRQAQLPPGQVLPPRQPSIVRPSTKSQSGAALRSNAPVVTAVITKHTQEVVDVPTEDGVSAPQIVIVEPRLQPVTIEFRSRSSPVTVNTVHEPGEKGQVQQTRSEEEPDRIIHEVVKPVIQEIREIIQPFRKITQQILPVQEEVHSIVTKGERRSEVEQVVDESSAALAGAIPDTQQQEEQQAATNSQERSRESSGVIQLQSIQVQPQPVQTLQAVPVQTFQIQPTFLSAPPLAPPPPPPTTTNTVVQAGLVGGTRILPTSETIYEQQREIVSAIAAPGGLKKKRSANIFRFNLH